MRFLFFGLRLVESFRQQPGLAHDAWDDFFPAYRHDMQPMDALLFVTLDPSCQFQGDLYAFFLDIPSASAASMRFKIFPGT